MAYLIDLPSYYDKRGCLTVIEKILPFEIKRVYYIYGVNDSVRGGHKHITTVQAVICLNGSCVITTNNGKKETDFLLNSPEKTLILMPEDWHTMHSYSENSILLVLASEYFDEQDYIYDKYE